MMNPYSVAHITAFPFAQAGVLLRWLSLSGGVGNMAAWVLYVSLCASPLIFLAINLRQREKRGESSNASDIFPLVLSPLLFAVMYLMINPGAMPGNLRLFPPEVGLALAGLAVWSVLAAWGMMVFIRYIYRAGEELHRRCIHILLYVLAVSFGTAAAVRLWAIPGAFEALRTANTGQEGLGLTYFYILLRAVIEALPHIMNIFIVSAGIKIIKTIPQSGLFSQAMVNNTRTLPRICVTALTVTFISNAAYNTAQFAFAAGLADVHMNFTIPVVPVLFMLGALFFARYTARAHEMHEENEGFV
jgi:hypothetical protein